MKNYLVEEIENSKIEASEMKTSELIEFLVLRFMTMHHEVTHNWPKSSYNIILLEAVQAELNRRIPGGIT